MITEAMVEAAVTAQKKWYQDAFEFNDGPDTDVSERAGMRAALKAAEWASPPYPLRAPEAAAWQPIETAPKDGTEILAWDGHDIYLIWWSDTIGLEDGTTGAFVDASMYFGKALTHWRRLPEPPLNDGATP